eukprot:COSAG03_NODE_4029_length_1713_cov_6.441140_2_plen_205_part_00
MGHRQEHTRQRTTAPHAASPDHPGESWCPCRLRGGVGAQPPPQCPLSLHVVVCLLGSLHLVAHCLLHCRQFACLLYSALACFSLECVLCVCREFVVVSFLQQFYLSLHLVGLKLDPWHMCVPCGPCHRFCPHFVEFRVFLQPQPPPRGRPAETRPPRRDMAVPPSIVLQMCFFFRVKTVSPHMCPLFFHRPSRSAHHAANLRCL